MNKKIGIILVFVLLVGSVFLTACQQEAVGGRVAIDKTGENLLPTDEGIRVTCGSCEVGGEWYPCSPSVGTDGDGVTISCSAPQGCDSCPVYTETPA